MRKVYFGSPSHHPDGNIAAYQFHLLQKFSDQVNHSIFMRADGVSKGPYESLNVRYGIGDTQTNVEKNRNLICKSLGVKTSQLISADQTHSKNVQIIDEEFLRYHPPGKELADIDAFVSDVDGIALMVQVADCQALLMYDPGTHVIAAVHAGWKGLAANISGETITVLRRHYGIDPKNLIVAIAPSLGPCCAFFSNPEVELPASFHPFIDEQKRVDLWSYSLDQLQKHGVQKRHIELAKVCTQCDPKKRFFSFRGQHGITGRFGVVIALKG